MLEYIQQGNEEGRSLKAEKDGTGQGYQECQPASACHRERAPRQQGPRPRNLEMQEGMSEAKTSPGADRVSAEGFLRLSFSHPNPKVLPFPIPSHEEISPVPDLGFRGTRRRPTYEGQGRGFYTHSPHVLSAARERSRALWAPIPS